MSKNNYVIQRIRRVKDHYTVTKMYRNVSNKICFLTPSGPNTFYFFPSLQWCPPLWVDLLKSWLRGGWKDGSTKAARRKRERERCGKKLICSNLVYQQLYQRQSRTHAALIGKTFCKGGFFISHLTLCGIEGRKHKCTQTRTHTYMDRVWKRLHYYSQSSI